MDNGKPQCIEQSRKVARLAFTLSLILFLVYLANIVTGKLTVLGYLRPGWGLNDVSEFLFLLAATTAFIAGTLLLERSRKSARNYNEV